MINDITKLENDGLRIAADTPIDEIARIKNALDAMKERIKEVDALITSQLIQRIKEAGPFVIGFDRYYVGRKKLTPKCVDVAKGCEWVLTKTGGDWDKFISFLSAQPIKYGAAKTLLGEELWNELFKVEEVDELRTEPADKLCKADTRFLK
jgi:hypothetical protein